MEILDEIMKVAVQLGIAEGELQAARDSIKEACDRLKELEKKLMEQK